MLSKKKKLTQNLTIIISNSWTSLTLTTQWCCIPFSISKAPQKIRALDIFVPVITTHANGCIVVVMRCALVNHIRISHQRFIAVYVWKKYRNHNMTRKKQTKTRSVRLLRCDHELWISSNIGGIFGWNIALRHKLWAGIGQSTDPRIIWRPFEPV